MTAKMPALIFPGSTLNDRKNTCKALLASSVGTSSSGMTLRSTALPGRWPSNGWLIAPAGAPRSAWCSP